MAGLPRDAADLHDAVLDLGHLHLEQPLEQPGMCAADDDLRALHAAANLGDVRLEALAIAVRLGWARLPLRQHGHRLPTDRQRATAAPPLEDGREAIALAHGQLLLNA